MSIAAIHAVKSRLGISEAAYRQILFDLGVRSSKDLPEEDHRRVMAAMYQAAGVHDRPDAKPASTPTTRKIWALWFELKTYLPDADRRVDYLVGLVCNAAGVGLDGAQAFNHLSKVEAYKAIEALKLRLEQEKSRITREVPF